MTSVMVSINKHQLEHGRYWILISAMALAQRFLAAAGVYKSYMEENVIETENDITFWVTG